MATFTRHAFSTRFHFMVCTHLASLIVGGMITIMAEAPATKPTVYIETTIVSCLTAWPAKDVIRQAQQEVTKQWWQDRRDDFEVFISQFVLDGSAAGDQSAAAERLRILGQLPIMHVGDEVEPLADRLLRDGALPLKARLDALHLAVAAANGMEYLLTWNCKHLANAVLWSKIEQTCRSAGCVPPTICTPYELSGSNP